MLVLLMELRSHLIGVSPVLVLLGVELAQRHDEDDADDGDGNGLREYGGHKVEAGNGGCGKPETGSTIYCRLFLLVATVEQRGRNAPDWDVLDGVHMELVLQLEDHGHDSPENDQHQLEGHRHSEATLHQRIHIIPSHEQKENAANGQAESDEIRPGQSPQEIPPHLKGSEERDISDPRQSSNAAAKG